MSAENRQRIINDNLSEAEIAQIEALPQESFKLVQNTEELHDQAFETKPVSYLHDCFRRFAKNKGSIVAGIIILLIVLYAIIVPFTSSKANVSKDDFPNGFRDINYQYALPYNPIFEGTGFWDGTKEEVIPESSYYSYYYDDSNHKRIDVLARNEVTETIGSTTYTTVTYKVRLNTYFIGNKIVTMSKSEYEAFTNYEKELGIYHTENSISKPMVDSASYLAEYRVELEGAGLSSNLINSIIDQMNTYYVQNPQCYFALTALNPQTGKYSQNRFFPRMEVDGEVMDIYARDSEGELIYTTPNSAEYDVRVDYFDYFEYRYGFEPYFLFGANAQGQDICLRLAEGTRFSLLLGVGISLINFIIGLVWGAISGYYGGTADLIMERVTDIIANIPSIIILTICSVQFTSNQVLIGSLGSSGIMILAILVAFVYSGWVGVAATTRMQFYRFKGQEYVLASRTLGAKDRRLIFKHILPNAIGTLVTSSVLMIPSVIFSESSLSYLGIINFTTSGLSSIGSLLSEGQQAGLQNYPHMLLFPCIVISLLMICFNLFGNGLRDAFNTSLKGSED